MMEENIIPEKRKLNKIALVLGILYIVIGITAFSIILYESSMPTSLVVYDKAENDTVVSVDIYAETPKASPGGGYDVQAVSCGDVITESIILTGDLDGCVGDGLVVTEDNVVIDCAGYTINGSKTTGSYGIHAINARNLTIKKCTVEGFETGIKFYYVNESLVANNTIHSNSENGIYMNWSDYNIIANNTFEFNDQGLLIESSYYNDIDSNWMEGNYYGIYMAGYASYNTLGHNTIEYSQKDGIHISNDSIENEFTSTRSCFSGQSEAGYYDINDLDNNTFTSNNCDSANNTVCHSSCETLISCRTHGWSEGETFTLDGSINAGGDCMIVDADNVVLDCQGYGIKGVGSNYGIYIEGRNNVTVKNCAVSDFYTSIYALDSTNVNITGGTANWNSYAGIWLGSSNYSTVNSVAANNNDYGIVLSGAFNNTILGANADTNDYDGIYIKSGSQHNEISSATASNNGNGIEVYQSDNNTFYENTAENNEWGFYISSSSQNIFELNTAEENDIGMYIEDSDNNTFINSTADYNSYAGIHLTSSANNNTFNITRACYNNQSYSNYYDINDQDNNSFESNTCYRANNASCDSSCSLPYSMGGPSGTDIAINPTTGEVFLKLSGFSFVKINISGDFDIGDAVANVSGSGEKVLLHFGSASRAGLETIELIVKKAGAKFVRICPNATSLDNVTAGCDGEIILNSANPSIGGYNLVSLSDPDYWHISADASTFSTGAGSGDKGGKVSTKAGDSPFWTSSDNPQTISLKTGESQLVTFYVNATGPEADYEFYAYANVSSNESRNNVSQTINITIIEFPKIAVIYPQNNTEEISHVEVSFTYNVSDTSGLANCSLIINNALNATDFDVENSQINKFDVLLQDGEQYNWSIRCADNSTFFNTAEKGPYNLTINIETSPPAINLRSPANITTITSSTNVAFKYNVTDQTEIANCTVIAKDQSNNTFTVVDYSVELESENSISMSLTNQRTYTWQINCTDNSTNHNKGSSKRRKFTLSVPSAPRGGGGGGGGGELPPTECYTDNDCALTRGFGYECFSGICMYCNECELGQTFEQADGVYTCALLGNCYIKDLLCMNECSEGETSCSADDREVLECSQNAETLCYQWQTSESCGSDEECSGAACQCIDTCSTDECSGSSSRKDCGNYDDDSCLEFSPSLACGTDEVCIRGRCVPSDEEGPGDDEIRKKFDVKVVGTGGTPSGGGCTEIIDRTSNTSLETQPVSVRRVADLPAGYDIIKGPFTIDCLGDSFIMTLNIPADYTDVKAIRCAEGQCVTEVYTMTEKQFSCGEELAAAVTEERRFIEPDELEVIIGAEKVITEEDKILSSGKNTIEFLSPVPLTLQASIGSPGEEVPRPRNQLLAIVGTPLSVKLIADSGSTAGAMITLPYAAQGIEEDSVAVYALNKEESRWAYIGGNVNLEGKTVTANVENIFEYEEGGKAIFAAIAVKCEYCEASEFEKVYQSPGSRNAVVLVHGLGSSPATFDNLVNDLMLNEQPWQVWTFGYSSSRDIDVVAQELAELLESHSIEYDNLYIVAHSLGGLITQQALRNSDVDRQKYPYVEKVRKVVLVGTPNEGTPGAEVYKNLYKYLANFKSRGGIFNVNSEILEELTKGRIIPRIEGVDYYVLAGIKPYEFNVGLFQVRTEEFFEMAEENDGIVTVRSAQHIGDSYVNDMCEDFWEINATHTDLIDIGIAVRVIERILSEGIKEAERDTSLVGLNQYFKLRIDQCYSEDIYLLIGKKIMEEKVYDELLCKCGNGFCGEGENSLNCPADCARILTPENIILSGPAIIYTFSLLAFALSIVYIFKKYLIQEWAGRRWLDIIATMLVLTGAASVLYSVNYEIHLGLAYFSVAFTTTYILAVEIWSRLSGFNNQLLLKKRQAALIDERKEEIGEMRRELEGKK